MAKKTKSGRSSVINRRAKFDYELEDTYTVGIALTGREAKALRMGHGQLQGAYVTIKDNELWLVNAAVSGLPGVLISDSEQTRTRKLLAKRREIDQIVEAKHQGRTVVPLEILTQGRHIKLRIAVGKGKKKYDKRQVIKKREESRHISRVVKNR